jgi:hypothetical protein
MVEDLSLHARAGVTLVRCPGLAGEPPEWFGSLPDLPRAVHAGPWLTRPGQFFDGWGLRPPEAEHLRDDPGTGCPPGNAFGPIVAASTGNLASEWP